MTKAGWQVCSYFLCYKYNKLDIWPGWVWALYLIGYTMEISNGTTIIWLEILSETHIWKKNIILTDFWVKEVAVVSKKLVGSISEIKLEVDTGALHILVGIDYSLPV